MEKMKYVDLHTHLGSNTPAYTLYEIAIRRGMNIKLQDEQGTPKHLSQAYYEFVELITGKQKKNMTHNDYLKKFDLIEDIQSTTSSVEKSIRSALMSAFLNDDVDLMEIRFNPMLRNKAGFYDIDRIIESACMELKKVTGTYPIKAGIIVCTDYRFTGEQSHILAKKAVKYAQMGVVGFDVAGPNEDYTNFTKHLKALKTARDGGLGVTVHAGEVHGADEIKHMLRMFVPDRIGHGINAHTDPHLMDDIAKDDILLEICPSSNFRTQIVPNSLELANILKKFDYHNIKYNLNTDGKIFLGTDVSKEYLRMAFNMQWNADDIARLNEIARQYSFVNGGHL